MKKLFEEGFDEAAIGVLVRCGQSNIIVYDQEKIIEILMKDMEAEAAIEHFEFNIQGAWVGDDTPGFLYRATMKEINEEWAEE